MQKHLPYFTTDNVSNKFLQDVFKTTPQEFAYKFENYALLGVKSLAANANQKKVALKQLIRETLNSRLRMLPKLP